MKPISIEISNKIAQQTGLKFVSEKEAEGNVCMASSSEIRAEFRESFSTIDIFDYIYGYLDSLPEEEIIKESSKINSVKIPLPTTLYTFQKWINLGSQIRQNPLLESAKTKTYFSELTFDGEYILAKF